MAEADKKKSRKLKPAPTVRQKTEKAVAAPEKKRRFRKAGATVAKPIKTVSAVGKKEYYIPMPKNRFGKFLNKRRRIIPKYFREAWAELKQVTWPTRKETWKLTFAVFIFAIGFAVLIGILDYGLDKIFKKILI